MAKEDHESWRELCNAAIEAQDPDELMKIIQELNKTLEREERLRRDFMTASKATKPPKDIRRQ